MADETTTEVPVATFGPPIPGRDALQAKVTAAAQANGLDPEFVHRLIQQESGWNPLIKHSKAGAVGLMQILPSTAKDYGVTDLENPDENIKAGIAHLTRLNKKFGGDQQLLAAAYNAGEGAVAAHGNTVPNFPETQKYVQAVSPVATYGEAIKQPEPPKPPSPKEQKEQANVAAYAKANPSMWQTILDRSGASGVMGLAEGAAHTLVEQANHIRPMLEKIPGVKTAFGAMDAAVPPVQVNTTNTTAPQKVGSFITKAAEYAAPGALAAKGAGALTAGASLVPRMLAQGVAGGAAAVPVALAVGDDPKTAAAAGALGGALSEGAATVGPVLREKAVKMMSGGTKATKQMLRNWPVNARGVSNATRQQELSEFILDKNLTLPKAEEEVARLGGLLDAAKAGPGQQVVPGAVQHVEDALVEIQKRFPNAKLSADIDAMLGQKLYNTTPAQAAVPASKILGPNGQPVTPAVPAQPAVRVPRTDVTATELQGLAQDMKPYTRPAWGVDRTATHEAAKAVESAIREGANSVPEMAAAKEGYGAMKIAREALDNAKVRADRMNTVNALHGTDLVTGTVAGGIAGGPAGAASAASAKLGMSGIKEWMRRNPIEAAHYANSLSKALAANDTKMIATIMNRLTQMKVINAFSGKPSSGGGNISERTKVLMDQMRAQNDETVK